MPATTPSAPLAFVSARYGTIPFRERFLVSGPEDRSGWRWGDYQARRFRYALAWAFYEGNVYRDDRPWAAQFKASYALYPAIRPIANPAYRIVEFWAGHLMGGGLDDAAGDGSDCPTSLPIVTENTDLPPVIAQIFRDSNWQAGKETWTRYGAAMGDAPLTVVDDEANGRVYLTVPHPSTLRHFERDDRGNCRGYVLQELRPDPRLAPGGDGSEIAPTALYTEVAYRLDGSDSVLYQTYLDGEPYNWRDDPDAPAEWVEEYGFVPMVLAQHRDIGQCWGMGELHTNIPKFIEIDDLTSKVDDEIRKTVDAQWLYVGLKPAAGDNSFLGDEDGGELDCDGAAWAGGLPPIRRPRDGRRERSSTKIQWCSDPNAKAIPLVANLPIAAATAQIATLRTAIEADHPELQADMATSAGDASGRALRVARERVEAMVSQRRAGYDDALVRALRMAISIGAQKGYPGFGAFDAGSYARGDLDFTIKPDRPVFAVDNLDRIAEQQATAAALKAFADAGLPLEMAMERLGFDAEDMEEYRGLKAEQQAEDKARMQPAVTPATTMPPPAVPGESAPPADETPAEAA